VDALCIITVATAMLSPPFVADLPLSGALFKRVPLPMIWPVVLIYVLFSTTCASVFGTDRQFGLTPNYSAVT
jgi:hypothetical protein